MKLAPGVRLGPYEIVAPIGVGGMGEVYRATDTRLGRTVAVKVLPVEFANDANLKIRFEREAKAISVLNHPNICSLYDIGDDYLVMEYCEGPTLADRLALGPLSLTEVLVHGVQIAEALHQAHRAGIVHRDLKPSNIIVTKSGVKLLDFGLARQHRDSREDESTLQRLTNDGAIPGTIQYMAPEVLRGDDADPRSDVFALGAVLYEMVTGTRPFDGASRAEVIAAVLDREPLPIESLRTDVPASTRRTIRACLAKDPELRTQTARDVALQLQLRREQAAPRSSRLMLTIGVLAVAIGTGVFVWHGARPRTGSVAETSMSPLTSFEGFEAWPALSPDGRQIAYVWRKGAGGAVSQNVYVQLIGQEQPLQLTRSASFDHSPVWSPDGREVAFLRRAAGGALEIMAVPALGGSERLLATLSARPLIFHGLWSDSGGVDYSPDGRMLAYADRWPGDDALSIVLLSLDSGQATRLTTPERYKGHETSDALPEFSPDGRQVAFVRYVEGSGGAGAVYVHSIETGRIRQLATPDLGFIWDLDWTADGSAVVVASGRTMTATHLSRLPLSLAAPVGTDAAHRFRLSVGDGARQFSIAADRLAFSRWTEDTNVWRVSGPAAKAVSGPEKLIASTRSDIMPSLSPDGRRIAFVSDRSSETWEIWVANSDGSDATQLTRLGHAIFPAWSPAGDRIVFSSAIEGSGVYVIDARGGMPRKLTDDRVEEALPVWSGDGRAIYLQSTRGGGPWQIWRKDLATRRDVPLTSSPGLKLFPREDGGAVFFRARDAVWSVPAASGGRETLIIPATERVHIASFAPWRGQIIYMSAANPIGETSRHAVIAMIDLQTKLKRILHELPVGVQPHDRLSVSADGEWIVYTALDRNDSDLVLVDNFE